MSEGPTPETDAVRDNVFDIWGGWSDNAAKKLLKHARRLERERDVAREQRDHLLKQLEAERALADRLAALVQRNRDLYGGQQVDPQCGCWDCEYLRPIDDALNAWKEARGE